MAVTRPERSTFAMESSDIDHAGGGPGGGPPSPTQVSSYENCVTVPTLRSDTSGTIVMLVSCLVEGAVGPHPTTVSATSNALMTRFSGIPVSTKTGNKVDQGVSAPFPIVTPNGSV